MRFLRLDFRDDVNSLDFHPLITVVTALESGHQRQMFEAVRRLSSGSTVGLRGLVEHEGLLVELDAAAGDPLAPVTTTAAVLIYLDGLAVNSGEVGLQAEIDQWERQAAIDAVAVEEIRSDIDLAIKARAYELREGAALENERNLSSGGSRRLKVAAIRKAFDAVNEHEPTTPQSDELVTELIEQWDEYAQLRDESEDHLSSVAQEVAEAENAVLAATAVLNAANDAAQPVLLTAEQESRLEALSDLSRESSRRGRRKKGLSEEDDAERKRLLAIVGVKSWTEYSLSRMSPKVSEDKLAVVADAEADLAVAKQALELARAHQAQDPIARDLNDRLESIKSVGQPYLGVLIPNDIGAALREQIVHVENPEWAQALRELRDALSSNDLHPPHGFERAEILGWTDSWLRAQGSLDSSLTPEAEPEVEEPSPEEIAEQLAAVNQSLARHNRALSQIDRAERAAVRSAMRVRDLKKQLRDRTTGPEATTGAEILSMIEPVADHVLEDVGGSVPIAVVGDMGGLADDEVNELMDSLIDVADRVQVIMVTDHQGVAAWVERVGLEHAALADGTRILI